MADHLDSTMDQAAVTLVHSAVPDLVALYRFGSKPTDRPEPGTRAPLQQSVAGGDPTR